MRWYQPIECDNTVKNPLVCEYSNLEDCGFDYLTFLKGEKMYNWKDNLFFQSKEEENDGDPDDVLQNAYMIPIYSKTLIKELIDERIEGIQYLPVKILNSKEEKINGFCIANFLNFIEAFDYAKSKYKRFSMDFPNPNARGKITLISKYVLKKDKLSQLDVIRLAEYQQAFFVSEKFKNIFEQNKFTGYSFHEVELV